MKQVRHMYMLLKQRLLSKLRGDYYYWAYGLVGNSQYWYANSYSSREIRAVIDIMRRENGTCIATNTR